MYYAEFNTDRIIRETYFSDFDFKGTMIEVGAGPVEFYSMSKHFRDSGWRCICVEPNPKFVEDHKKLGNEIYQYACSNSEGTSVFKVVSSNWSSDVDGISFSSLGMKYPMQGQSIHEIEVDTILLDTLLKKISVSKVDFLSVDVEGWELEVLDGFSLDVFSPKVVLLENYLHSNSYVEYMESKNYKLDMNVEYNYIFTKK